MTKLRLSNELIDAKEKTMFWLVRNNGKLGIACQPENAGVVKSAIEKYGRDNFLTLIQIYNAEVSLKSANDKLRDDSAMENMTGDGVSNKYDAKNKKRIQDIENEIKELENQLKY
jgi:hypothetical protein